MSTNGTVQSREGEENKEDEPLTRRLPRDDDDEPLPETLRSSVLVLALEPVSRPIIIDEVPPPKDAHCAA